MAMICNLDLGFLARPVSTVNGWIVVSFTWVVSGYISVVTIFAKQYFSVFYLGAYSFHDIQGIQSADLNLYE